MIKKIILWLFYRRCKVWKENDGFACFVCTTTNCFRNRFLQTLKFWNGKCVYKDCQNKRLENQFCEKHQNEKE